MEFSKANRYIMFIFCIFTIITQISIVNAQERRISTSPKWSPNGDYIAFVSRIGSTSEILSIDKNNNLRSLTGEINDAYIADIEWSPDGDYIAYTLVQNINENATDLNIWIAPFLEGEPYNLTSDITGTSSEPAWSPNGNQIIFINRGEEENNNAQPTQVWIINIDKTDSLQVTRDDNCHTNPQWFYNDDAIAFISILCLDQGDETGLYRYDFSDKETHILREGQIIDYIISPIDEIVLAESQEDSVLRTDIIRINGENVLYLAEGLGITHNLSWSPNGEYLTMTTLCSGVSHIIQIHTETLELSDITACPSETYAGVSSWSPDSSILAYESGGIIWLYNPDIQGHSILVEDF